MQSTNPWQQNEEEPGEPTAEEFSATTPAWRRLLRKYRWTLFAVLLIVVSTGLVHRVFLVQPWFSDDYLQQAKLEGHPALGDTGPIWFSFFDFIPGDEAANLEQMNQGFYPWWLPMDAKVRFLRPVSVATHVFDHAVAPGNAVWPHIHNLLWFAAMTVCALLLYRRIFGRAAPVFAAWAAWLFCIDDARAGPVVYINNRNAMVCVVLVSLALLAHHHWRTRKWSPGLWVAPLLYAVSLLSAEAGIATLAFVFSYALFLDPAPRWRDRAMSLVPYAVVTIVWQTVYTALGYGVQGLTFYTDPLSNPGKFLSAFGERSLLLLADQWYSVPSVLLINTPPHVLQGLLIGLSVMLTTLSLGIAYTLRRSMTARFWGLAMVLALVLVSISSTEPHSRNLSFVALAAAPLLAEFLVQLSRNIAARKRFYYALVSTTGTSMIGLHIFLAPSLLVTGSETNEVSNLLLHNCEHVTPYDPSIRDKTVVLLNTNNICAGTLRPARMLAGKPVPGAVRLLADQDTDLHVKGIDRYTLELRPVHGFASSNPGTQLRGTDRVLPVGAVVSLEGMRVEIIEHNERGLVAAAQFRFDVPLDDPSLVWRAFHGIDPVSFSPPGPGQVVTLEKYRFPWDPKD